MTKSTPSSTDDRVSLLVGQVVALLGISLLVLIALRASDYQWDFRVYHGAPRALDDNSNPYDTNNAALGFPKGLSYLYPPVVLYIFRPLSRLPFGLAYEVWLTIKVCGLIALLRLWHVCFEPLRGAWWVPLLVVFAFNSALLRDLVTGNIAVLEQLGIWAGFALLLHRRPYWAGCCIAAAAQFKLMPVVFLGVLLLVGPPKRWKSFVASVMVFCGLLTLNVLLLPDMLRQYIESFASSNPNLVEGGSVNPSALTLFRDIASIFARNHVLAVDDRTVQFIFAVYALCTLGAFLWILRRGAKDGRPLSPQAIIYCACALFVLTMPRVKDYTYIVMLVPSLYVIRELSAGRVAPKLIVPMLLPLLFFQDRDTYVPVLRPLIQIVHSYSSWFLAWLVWAHLLTLNRHRSAPTQTTPPRDKEFAPS